MRYLNFSEQGILGEEMWRSRNYNWHLIGQERGIFFLKVAFVCSPQSRSVLLSVLLMCPWDICLTRGRAM